MVAPSQQHFAPRMTTQTAQRVKVKENGTCAMVPQSSVLLLLLMTAKEKEKSERQVMGPPAFSRSPDLCRCEQML